MAEKVKLTLEVDGKNISVLDSAKNKIQKVGAETQKTAKGFKLFEVAAVAAIAAAGFAVKKLASDSLKAYASMEKGLANVYTLLDKNTFEKHGKDIEEGALKVLGKYSFAIDDINKALFDSVSAGVAAEESINFLEKAARLAQGGVTGLGVAVDGMTSIINAYSLDQDRATDVANAFFTAQKFGKTTVEELSNNIGKVAPIAAAARISFEELLSATSQLTLSGISTDEAVTSLKGTITALISPASEAQEQLEALGIPFGKAAFEGGKLASTMAIIKEKSEGNIDVIAELIPNVRALLAVTTMATEEGLKKYDTILNAVRTDTESLTEAFNKQEETIDNLMAVYKNKFIVEQMKVGKAIAFTIKWLIKYNEKISEIKDNILLSATEMSNSILNFLGISTERWTAEQEHAKESMDTFLQMSTERVALAEVESFALTAASDAVATTVTNNEKKKTAAQIKAAAKRKAEAAKAAAAEKKAMQAHWSFTLVGAQLNADQRAAVDRSVGTSFSALTSLMGSESRTLFEIGKAASIAQVIINTIRGATDAIASTAILGPAGWIAGGIMAAAITAGGAASVAQISSTQMPAAEFGGIIPGSAQGMPVLAGERNKSEAIIPLEGEGAERLGLSGGNTINVYIDNFYADDDEIPRKVAEAIDEGLEDLRRTQSSSFAVGLETQIAMA